MPVLVYYFTVYLYYRNIFQQVKYLHYNIFYGNSKKVPKMKIPVGTIPMKPNIFVVNSLVSTGDTGRQPPPPPTSGDLSRHNNS